MNLDINIENMIMLVVTIIFYTGVYISTVKNMAKRISNLERHNEEQDRRLNRNDVIMESINVTLQYMKNQLEELIERRNYERKVK